MTRTDRRLRHAALGVAFVALSCALSCSGLSDRLVEKAEAARARIEREAEDVETRAEQFAAFAEDSDNAFLRTYSERERWAERFDEARKELVHARAVYADEIAPRLEANRPEDEEAVGEQLSRVRKGLDRVAELAREPAQRAAFLADARDRAPEIVSAGAAKLAEATIFSILSLQNVLLTRLSRVAFLLTLYWRCQPMTKRSTNVSLRCLRKSRLSSGSY